MFRTEEGRADRRKGITLTSGPGRSVREGGKVELGRRANWAVGRELGRARRAGPVGKEEGGWAGGLKGRGGVKGLGSFFFSIFSNPFQTLNSFQSLNTSNPLQVFKLF
jgi:hypothetical protein